MTNSESRRHVYKALHDLEQDNAALRLKLARHEFRQMERELKSADPFKLDVYGSDTEVMDAASIPDVGDVMLPQLPVPMGSIHAKDTGTELPVIAVYDGGLTGPDLASALMGLMNTQYHSPFARLIFLCSGFEAIPFLGRYGFVFEHIGRQDPTTTLARLNRRYGATQIRALETGAVIAEMQDR